MGFIPVLLHLRTIFANMKRCKEDIVAWQPDVVILVDYPGFNLNIAKFLRAKTQIPVYYYISPKIWAWKEYRIKNIKRDVDELFSILPFEVEFFEGKHHYPIHYVGNPTVDEVTAFRAEHPETYDDFIRETGLDPKPIIALLAGSRKQEIKDNLPDMLRAASAFPEYQLVLAGAPGISPDYYHEYIGGAKVKILFGQTYRLLQQAEAALVTSGTATLETALFRVPQAVCYHTPIGKVISFLRRHILTVKYISLVNLIANREVVKELVADTMTVEQARAELERILGVFLLCFSMTREYVKSVSTVSIGKDFKSLLSNVPWWLLIGAALCSNLFNTVRGATAAYFFKDYIGDSIFLNLGDFTILFYAASSENIGRLLTQPTRKGNSQYYPYHIRNFTHSEE